MLQKLGRRKAAVPIVLCIVLACALSIMFYPMLHMEPKGLPFGIVDLDEGVDTSEGSIRLGDTVCETLTSPADSPGGLDTISWQKYDSEEQLDAAFARGELYGAIVIPRDFSQASYDALLETMHDQMGTMKDQMSDMLGTAGSPLDSMKGALGNTESLSSGTGAQGTPELSGDAAKAVDAANRVSQGALRQAKAAAAAALQLQEEYQSALDALEEGTEQVETAQEELSKAQDELAADPDNEDLKQAVGQREQAVDEAQAAVGQLQEAAEDAGALLGTAESTAATAQQNSKTAAANAMSLKQTMTVAATLQAKATALATTVSALKGLAQGGTMDLMSDEKIEQLAGAAAGKALAKAQQQMGETETAEEDGADEGGLTVYLDMAKSPLIANSMQANMKSILSSAGSGNQIVMLHDTPGNDEDDGGSSSPMTGMLGQQLAILPLIILSLIIGILLTRIFPCKDPERGRRLRSLAKQVVGTVVFSCIVAFSVYLMLAYVAGESWLSMESTVLFLWATSLGLMLLACGLSDCALGLGIAVAVGSVVLGMATGVLPVEALPAFWQDWVYPWAPQRFIGEGLRSIMYLGAGWWNGSVQVLLGAAAAGVLLALVAALTGPRRRKAGTGETPAVAE